MASAWKEILIVAALIILFIIGIFGILGLRRNLTTAPALDVALEDVTYTDQNKITVTGKTDRNSSVVVNGESVPTDNEGNFSFEKTLSPGENKITIESERNGKRTASEKTIVLQTEKEVNGATSDGTAPTRGDLSDSGPTENVLGTIGLLAIFFAYRYYTQSKKLKLSF